MSKNRVHNSKDHSKGSSPAKRLQEEKDSTDTIDLQSLFTKDLTQSGSFDIRGELLASTFGKVIQAFPVAAMLIDKSYRIMVANQACRKISEDYEYILDTSYGDLFTDPAAVKKGEAVLEQVFTTRKPVAYEAKLQIGDNRIWGRMTFRSVRLVHERLVLLLIEDLTVEKKQHIRDEKHREELEREISERKRVEKAATRAKREWERTFDAVPDLIALLDGEHHILRLNRAMADKLGMHPRDAIGRFCHEICHGTSTPLKGCPLRKAVDSGVEHASEVNEQRLGGTFLVSVTPVIDPDDGTTTFVHVARDFTERKRLEDTLRKMAATDGLTGLFNLRHFRQLSLRELDRAKRYRHPLVLMMTDLDHFKSINDEFGHDVGDRVLQLMADIAGKNLRDSDIFARLGGDEFAILLPETGLSEARSVAERLREAVEDAILITNTGTLKFTLSVGIAEVDRNAPDLDTLMKHADAALYSAKDKGRNRVEAFSRRRQ